MSADDFWVQASAWARKRFRCDYLASCGKPVRRIHIREGEPQFGYCYQHYLEAKNQPESQFTRPEGKP